MTFSPSKLSTRYALLFAALLLSVTFLTLGFSGYLIFQRTNELRSDLEASFSSVHTSNDVEALRKSGSYLSNRLFNPLFNVDISTLNEELAQIQSWLQPRSLLVADRDGRVVTDASDENSAYGETVEIPSGLAPGQPLVMPTSDGRLLFFVIGYGEEIAGYARVELSDQQRRRLTSTLAARVADAWAGFQSGFVTIALVCSGLVIVMSFTIGGRMSASLSRPLIEMAEAAEQFAAGRLNRKLPEGSPDEIGRLAGSLNKMAEDLEKAGRLLDRAQEMASFGYWEWQRGEDLLVLSYGVYKTFGVDNQAFAPTVQALLGFVAPESQERLFAILQGRFEGPVSAEFDIRRADGEARTLFIRGEPDRNANNEIIGVIGTIQDITEQQRSNEQLHQLANYDGLTGLPNRNLFYDRLSHAIKQARRRQSAFALLFLDLDRFKSINDALGHDVGDELLRHVARRLQNIVRDSDTLARVGGDEFTLIVEDLNEESSPQKIAQNIIRAMTPAFRIAERDLFVSTSIGVALYPKDATDIDVLIKNADTAMYLAKEQGKAVFRFFTPDLDRQAHERLALESQLREAVENDEFELHFQPQVDSGSGKLIAVEALLRWRGRGELQSAAKFVPVLEDTGLITRLTGSILNIACDTLKQLHRNGSPNLRMCVNLSAAQFQQPDLMASIDRVLAESRLRPELLEIEITESTLLDRNLSESNAAELAARGIRLAMDDFGTGYSSLTYLKRFDVDVLKIDRSFVSDMCRDEDDAQIVSALLNLSHNLGIECVAEGVEDEQQLELLRDGGCDLVQGFFICRPLPLNELLTWIAVQRSVHADVGTSRIA